MPKSTYIGVPVIVKVELVVMIEVDRDIYQEPMSGGELGSMRKEAEHWALERLLDRDLSKRAQKSATATALELRDWIETTSVVEAKKADAFWRVPRRRR